jgi:hypothetical protein
LNRRGSSNSWPRCRRWSDNGKRRAKRKQGALI